MACVVYLRINVVVYRFLILSKGEKATEIKLKSANNSEAPIPSGPKTSPIGVVIRSYSVLVVLITRKGAFSPCFKLANSWFTSCQSMALRQIASMEEGVQTGRASLFDVMNEVLIVSGCLR